MTARVAAGRLGHVDLGKTITVPMGGPITLAGTLAAIAHGTDGVGLDLRLKGGPTFTVPLTPHTLVTITGKDAS